MPLYFGFLFFIMVLSRLGCSFCPWISRDDAVSLGLYIYNFRVGFTQHFLYGLHHFWSLGVEEHFYLLWPLVIWALRRRALIRLCLAVAVASLLLRVIVVLSGVWPLTAFFITPCRVDGLLAGSLVALAWRDEADWTLLKLWAGRLVLGTGCLLLGIALGQRHFLPDADPNRGHMASVDGSLVVTVGIAALAVFFSGLIVLAVDAAEGSRLRRLLERTELRAIGKYSYAIYVFHSLILLATVQFLSPLSRVPAFIAKPVAVIWVSAASFVVAWLSYHLFEKHFLRLKRYFRVSGSRSLGLSSSFTRSFIEMLNLNFANRPIRRTACSAWGRTATTSRSAAVGRSWLSLNDTTSDRQLGRFQLQRGEGPRGPGQRRRLPRHAREKKVVVKDYRDGFFPFLGGQIKEEFEALKREFTPIWCSPTTATTGIRTTA